MAASAARNALSNTHTHATTTTTTVRGRQTTRRRTLTRVRGDACNALRPSLSDPADGAQKGRSARRAAPVCLPELKLGTKPYRAAISRRGGGAATRARADDELDNVAIGNPGAGAASELVGERSGAFALSDQSPAQWMRFFALLSFVGLVMWVVWLDPDRGLGTAYTSYVEDAIGGDKGAAMLLLLAIFGVAHSGMAALRRGAEGVIGPRAWRVVFASISLPLATSTLLYFIANRYSGVELWNLRGLPGVHEAVWSLSFVSFIFLYPSTFNLLEVAAIDEPKVHLYETGIIRISRHPQMVGQLVWCAAHMLWTGNSFVAVASAGLMAHHAFGCWHGDRRLRARHGEAFDAVKARTSVVPFAAILDGRQRPPPPDAFLREFLEAPYFAIVAFTLGAYALHPFFQTWAHDLHY